MKLAKRTIKGPSHKRGGVPFNVNGKPGFEAQGGEFISSVPTTRMFFPVLDAMNKIGNRFGNNTARINSISSVPPSTNFELVWHHQCSLLHRGYFLREYYVHGYYVREFFTCRNSEHYILDDHNTLNS